MVVGLSSFFNYAPTLHSLYFPNTSRINPHASFLKHRSRTILNFSVSSMASSAAKKVMIPVANGTEEMEAVITIDVLRRAGAEVAVASVEKEIQIVASRGVKIVADVFVEDCEDATFDLIALPGGALGATNLHGCGALEKIMKKHATDGRLYAAICASPAVVLDKWGLLNGLKATCHPSFMDKFSSATPVESRVQQDGRVVTSRGPGTTIEFALALVEQLYGKEKFEEVAGPLLFQSHEKRHDFHELNPLLWSVANPAQILVPIANGTEEMEAVIVIDVLRRAKANVVVASIEDKLEIVASRKVKLVADMLLDDALKMSYDLIVLPGGLGGADAFSQSQKLIELIRKQAESNRPYGAICAAPAVVLEPHGLLMGKKATAYPALSNKLSDQSEVENRVLVDGNLITSRGPGTAMEFALGIVEKLFGREKAVEVANPMVFSYP